MQEKISNLKKIILNEKNNYLIANDNDISTEEFIDKIASFLKSNYNIIHYIPTTNNDSFSLEIAKKIRQLTSIYNSLFFISSRADIAKISDADGIILNSNDMNLKDIQKIIHDDKFFGYIINEPYNDVLSDENVYDIILIQNELKEPIKQKLASLKLNVKIFNQNTKIDNNFSGANKL